MKHPAEFALALYATGDLSMFDRLRVRFHLSNCEACRKVEQAYRNDQAWIQEKADELPEGVNWDRLSREMTANIRVGIAAGECVAPRERKAPVRGWRPVAVAAGLMVVLGSAWWLNVPEAQNESLKRAMVAIFHRGTSMNGSGMNGSGLAEDRRPTVFASPTEIKLVENGGTLSMSQGGMSPVAVSVNAEGSASARYVDTDTGQVTITSVYVQ
jgi:hypothetical protein